MFKRILVPLDGSSRAEQALPAAVRIARASAGSIVLLQVVNPPIDYGAGLAPVAMITEDYVDAVIAEEHSYLSGIAQSDVCRGVRTQAEVQFGLPAQQILGVAESQAVDLIFMGSHGRTGVTRWMLGSVAEQVISQSTVPVLVVREGGPALVGRHADAARPFSALIPLDGSPLAETALLPAANLVAVLGGTTQGMVHLLQVVGRSASAAAEGVSSQEGSERRAQAYLMSVRERLLRQTHGLNLAITCSVLHARDITQAIVTSGNNYDLLAMATHGRGGLERLVIGSVTERVLHSTKLPLLVVRPRLTSVPQAAECTARRTSTT